MRNDTTKARFFKEKKTFYKKKYKKYSSKK